MSASLHQPSSDAINKLEQARRIALGDASFYPQIVPGVLPIVGPSASLDIRRWGAEFLAETFACPTLPPEHKEELALKVLPALRGYLEPAGQDTAVVKSVVQAATSIYPLVFRNIVYNPNGHESWQNMVAIKSNILKRMDSSPSGVKVCCVKFIQRVVQVQTPGFIADPRRPEQNETSLALVQSDHPILSPPNLQAEAFGLLDRLLSVFQENTSDDALIITATLNSVGVLVRTRASVAGRILNAILSFNPFRIASSSLSPRIKVMVKSMERTIRAFLLNLNKRSNPNHPLAARVQVYLERMHQSRVELFEENARKRGAPNEATNEHDSIKRQRLGADQLDTPPQNLGPPMPPGSITLAQLFTLTDNEAHKSFDARVIQWEPLLRVLIPVLGAADQTQVDNAVNAVRARYLQYAQIQPNTSLDASRAAVGIVDDDEEYQPMDDAEPLLNRLDAAPMSELQAARPLEVALGPFIIAQPPPMSTDEVTQNIQATIVRVLGMIDGLQEPPAKAKQSGFNRLAASNYDRDSWVTVISRLATRSLAGLDVESANVIKAETADDSKPSTSFSVSDGIRESLYRYVIDDFRRRIDVAISWLNEEWYNDRVQQGAGVDFIGSFEKWALKVFDGILPYLDAKDNKILIRFLSEIPDITQAILERVKRLARDPERVQLATSSILYLILFRPPCLTICIDALEDLYLNYDDAKASAGKILLKWRPEALQSASASSETAETMRMKAKPASPGPSSSLAE